MIKYVLGLLAIAFLVGCAGQTRTETVTRVAIQAATVRVIDGDTERASRVSALVGRVQDQIAGGPDATIDQLEAELRGWIDWDELTPEERALVDILIAEVSAELQYRVGQGVLSDTQRVVIAEVLGWIAESANRV